MTKKHKG